MFAGGNITKLFQVIDRGLQTATNLSTNKSSLNGQKDISDLNNVLIVPLGTAELKLMTAGLLLNESMS